MDAGDILLSLSTIQSLTAVMVVLRQGPGVQASSATAVVSPGAVARCISAGRWPRDLLQVLLERVYQVLRAAPAAVRPLLQVAGAAAAAGAACVEVSSPRS